MSNAEFTQQFNLLRASLMAFAMNLTKDHNAAQDLVQETAFKAFKYRNKYQPQTNMRAWLMTIMRNAFINEYRKKKRRQTLNDFTHNDFLLNSGSKTVENAGESSITESEIIVQINALEEWMRIPFLLYLQGFKYEEIAREMDLPLGTVKSRIFFARRRLKEALRKIYHTEEIMEILA